MFASSRGRSIDVTSLWIARLGAQQPPRRLTPATGTDMNPVWTRDGTAIIFASTRDGGDFDLWRLPMVAGQASGPAEQLTTSLDHEVSPTVARDGTIIYAAVTPRPEALTEPGPRVRARTSHLEARAPDGTITVLTDGPDDGSPTLSPDDAQLAFTCGRGEAALANRELCIAPPHAARTAPAIVALPPTDEDGPAWSSDGRYLVATSLLRGEQHTLFSSAIIVDLREQPRRARILVDHAGAVSRITPAIVARTLIANDVAANPAYLPELARIMTRAIDEQAKRNAPSR